MAFETHDAALMTLKDVCAFTRWSKSTVRNRINAQMFPEGQLIGGRRYWQFGPVRDAVDELMRPGRADSRDKHFSV